jgi:hypothetical protein
MRQMMEDLQADGEWEYQSQVINEVNLKKLFKQEKINEKEKEHCKR